MKELSENFISYYKTNVKKLALLCSHDFKIMYEIEHNPEKYNEESPEVLKIKTLIDPNAVWYIGLMVGDIEHSLLQGKNLNLINSVSQVRGCLNSESYWTNVWKNDISTEEAKNLKKLASVMIDLTKLL
jgi:hypothetical protein